MKRRVADIIVETLIKHNITDCFSVVGGGAMHLNNAFAIHEDINLMYNHHEQACAMAAEGYARMSGKLAAVCVTSGPGGTNAVNGVQGAYVDSLPMIVISGHPRYATTVEATGLKHLRCRGVQENDIVTMVQKVTKYAKCVYDPKYAQYEVEKAIDIALDGRRGPVWIDVPLDVQGALVEESELRKYQREETLNTLKDKEIEELFLEIEKAERPCILTGSGIRTGMAWDEYQKFIQHVKIPIVGGCIQADINSQEDEGYYGMSGNSGPRCGNFILQNADLILVLGNSLSYKQTGFNQEEFAKHAKIIMVDAEEDEAKKQGLHIERVLVSDLRKFFEKSNKMHRQIEAPAAWREYCDMVKNSFPRYEMLEKNRDHIQQTDPVAMLDFWKHYMASAPKDQIIALGNSSCISGVLWEGTEYRQQRVLVNYNAGSMGHDLPNAIGAAKASGKSVTLVTGDGSIMMNLQELQTIRHYNLPVKVVVFSNHGYGAIRNTCTNFFHGTYTGCDEKSGVSFPEFSKVADTFGLPFKCCHCTGELDESIQWMQEQKGSCLLEVKERIDEIPNLKVGSTMQEDGSFVTDPLHELSPKLEKEQMEKFMIS